MGMKVLGVGALAAALVIWAAPVQAQSLVRGKVVDGQGKPVQDALIVFDSQDSNRRLQTKTDRNGDFLQIGLQSGPYKVTASKDGVGTQTLPLQVRQGPNDPLSFTLSPAVPAAAAASGVSAADKAAAALTAAASAAVDAMKAGRHDDAIAKFNEVLAKRPDCADCYYNIGMAYTAKQQYAEAEAAFKQAVTLKPDSPESFTGLANIYNAQKRFDLAADASAKAAQLTGGAAGGGAEATYNQGVIFFNAGKFEEARAQFEAASKADPNMGMAHYQLGMTSLNLGRIADAISALEAYLKVEPDGPKAAEVKAALPALQGMLKK
jgi:tetratricopeptide (TPR) repeat protein